MAQYSTDFSEYSIGVQPSDWTDVYSTTNSTWSVEAGGDIGGRLLRNTEAASASAIRHLKWDAIDSDTNRDDVELLAKVRTSSTSGHRNHLIGRATGSTGSENLYAFILGSGAANIRVSKFISGVRTDLSTVAFAWTADTWFWMRFRINGTSLRARIWQDGNPEPGTWNVDITDSSVTGVGSAGVGAFSFTDGSTKDFDVVAIGTAGDAAEIISTAGITGVGGDGVNRGEGVSPFAGVSIGNGVGG